MIRSVGLKAKLIAIQILPTTAIFLVICFFWVKSTLDDNYRSFQNRINLETSLIAENIQAAVLFRDKEAIDDILLSLANDMAFVRVAVNDENNNTLKEVSLNNSESRADADAGLADMIHTTLYGDSQTLRIEKPIVFEDRTIGMLVADAVTHEIVSAIDTILHGLWFIIAMGLALTLVLNRALHRILLKPILKISGFTRRIISSKDYSARIQLSQNDEMGRLVDDLNHMLEMVDERDRHLEETVSRRTEELSLKNSTLESQLAEIRRLEREREFTEKRFEQFFLQAPVATIVLTPSGGVSLHNGVFDRLIGLSDKSEVSFDDLISPEDQETFNDHLDRLINGGESSLECKVACLPTSGEEIKVVISMSSLRSSDDQLQYLILQFLDVSESDRLAQELEYQANHDVLTSLPNRRLLKQELADTIASLKVNRVPHALCILDLDRFKIINDSSGHAAGDKLLQELGKMLLEEIAPGDILARLGGDEFAILMTDCDEASAIDTAERIRARIREYVFVWESCQYQIGVSAGLVMFDDPDTDIVSLMKAADSACYEAKDHGRNRIHLGPL